MILQFIASALWQKHRQRPFVRLVQLFIARIFHGGGDGDAEGMDLGIGLVLSLLALPGGFVSVLLFNKYGSLLQWMRGAVDTDPFTTALPDEYFFIVLSMVVTGVVAIWKWDSIFPDRRDYFNLVPLAISTRTIFLANLTALLFLVGLLAVDVNTASSILFPLVVGATQSTFSFFFEFAAVHALVVVLASVFTFFVVFSSIGLLMAVLPLGAFRKISPYVRAVIVAALVTLLSTSFALPAFLRRLPGSPQTWTRFLPSCWFLGLCQSLRGRADPVLAALGRMAVPSVVLVMLISVGVYAVGYRRYFMRIAEMTDVMASRERRSRSWLLAWCDRLIFYSPFQKGGFRFVGKTLLRSEPHRLVLAGIAGLGLVLAAQALLRAFETPADPNDTVISADALSMPLILAFCMIVGLRLVFEIPVELRSNWIFRLMLDAEKPECEPLARKVILLAVLPWVFLVAFPIYVYFAGWMAGTLHTLLVAAWSALLTNAALIRFRKLPFTCAFPLFQQPSLVTLLVCVLAFVVFAIVTPELEHYALADPVWMAGFLPVAVVAWYIPHRIRGSTMEIERELIFEETPARAVEVLQIGN